MNSLVVYESTDEAVDELNQLRTAAFGGGIASRQNVGFVCAALRWHLCLRVDQGSASACDIDPGSEKA